MLNRRQFLTLLPGFVFLPQARMNRKTRKRVFILEHYVAGFQFYDGPAVIGSLHVGDVLSLKREPGNPYNRSAIAGSSRVFSVCPARTTAR